MHNNWEDEASRDNLVPAYVKKHVKATEVGPGKSFAKPDQYIKAVLSRIQMGTL